MCLNPACIGGVVMLFGFLFSVAPEYVLQAQSSSQASQTMQAGDESLSACKQFAASNGSGQRTMAQAELAHSRSLAIAGDLAQAEQVAERSLQLQATAEAWYQVALIRFGRADPRCSLAAFTTAASLRAPRSEDLRIVALDYVLLNDPSDAEKWLGAATIMDPVNAEAWYDLGRVFYTTKHFPKAVEAFNKVVALRPHDVKAETYLGLIAEADNETERAAAEYRTAIADQPSHGKLWALPYRSLGVLLRDSGHLDEAEEMLRQAVTIAPGDSVAHAELGQCLAKQHRWAQAQGELKAAIQLRPARAAWHFQLGRIDRELGLEDEAKHEFFLAKTQIEAAPEQEPEQ